MVLILEIYLAAMAYYSVQLSPYYSAIGYAATLLALMGMRESAACMAEPIGAGSHSHPGNHHGLFPPIPAHVV